MRITVGFYIMDYPRLSVLFRHKSKNNQLVTLQIPYLKGAGGQLTQNSPATCSPKTEAEYSQETPISLLSRMKYAQYVFLASVFYTVEYSLAQTCAVESFSVKDNFDPKRYAGKWYALAKKDPEGLFLQDNISAEYTVEEDGTMTASSKGRVKLFGIRGSAARARKGIKTLPPFHRSSFWVICADMAAQYTVPDPTTPAKMYMTYQGLASYLSSGGDNYWVIDTDYDNYAITYACRSLKEDGSCDDGYSLIFSRNPRGLPPAIQRIVRQKQEEICMSGQFQPVLQSGAC
ncbi:PREDICTED: purpurin isoform X2 [Ficedula albicollis]|uniref:purpurin isoform X2 n=1 Tax=Ficedula albicollis TaxID=59894 RepID=UPI00035A0449|nr:PREDICTED: purpurin isoform X2 [Ficedula albicollis]